MTETVVLKCRTFPSPGPAQRVWFGWVWWVGIPGERSPGCLPSAERPGQLERLAGRSTRRHTGPVGGRSCPPWPSPPPQTSAWRPARSAHRCPHSCTQKTPPSQCACFKGSGLAKDITILRYWQKALTSKNPENPTS